MDGATAPSRQAAETITSAAMRWCRFDPNQEPKHGLNLTIPRAASRQRRRLSGRPKYRNAAFMLGVLGMQGEKSFSRSSF
jgi:hypothetical protein